MHIVKCTEAGLSEAPLILRIARPKEVLIDMEAIEFLECSKMVRIKCIIELARTLELRVKVRPPIKAKVTGYAGRMGLFEGTNYQYPHRQKTPYRFLPLLRINDDRSENLYEQLSRIFSHMQVPSSYIGSLAGAFSELADNIFYHSGPSYGSGWGYVCGQAFPDAFQPKVSIGLSDVGVGIHGSYERNNQLRGRTEAMLLKDSFEYGETSLHRPKEGVRGIGLAEAREYIQTFENGSLYFRSGGHAMSISKFGAKVHKLDSNVSGTWVNMEVPIL